MERVGDFYARLPRGPAPEIKPTGLFQRYQARYFGKNPSKARKSRYSYTAVKWHSELVCSMMGLNGC